MTPLRAIEAMQEIKFVPSTRYPRNPTCANPECDKDSESTHHIFGRGKGDNSDSFFVRIPVSGGDGKLGGPIPHAVGLCGDGVKGCHGDVEAHRVWIRYEDGVFNWYDRVYQDEERLQEANWRATEYGFFVSAGPLDPQPALAVKNKKKKRRKNAEERKTRTRITISVPTGFAEGGRVWDEHFGNGKDGKPLGWVRKALGFLRGDVKNVDTRPEFELITDAMHSWRQFLEGEGLEVDFDTPEWADQEC